MSVRTRTVLHVFSICAAAILIAGCVALPSLENRTVSQALPADQSQATMLGKAISRMTAAYPGKSGIASLANPLDAFVARALLTRAAERTLDVQYYIWHKDLTGTLLLQALREAADRGV
ncbi:MAG TPA: phospholipase D family protein, partial [Candidimonas sp.]|nr:phospholipase D family protein [Candidimonas sp.]